MTVLLDSVPDGDIGYRTRLSDTDSHFTGQYGSILQWLSSAILLDVTTQLNIWSIIGVSGMRSQDIQQGSAGLGYIFIARSWLPSAAWYLILETWAEPPRD